MANLNDLLALLDRRPEYGRVLDRMLSLELAEVRRQEDQEALPEWDRGKALEDGLPEWFGIERKELGARPGWMDELVYAGVLRVVSISKSHTPYRLVDRAVVAAALRAWTAAPPPIAEEPGEIPSDLFAAIVGQKHVKSVLNLALAAPKPVHVLLAGDEPGTAKTLFLEELGRLPRALYADGALATQAGLVEALLAQQPQYLLLDQVDHLRPSDQHALLGVMAHGRVARLRYRDVRDERRNTWVFATANEKRRLSRPLLSRFQVMEFDAYSRDEFVEVCWRFLERREGVDAELARHIAGALADRTRSIRNAQRVGRLARSVREVDELLEILTFEEGAEAWSAAKSSAR